MLHCGLSSQPGPGAAKPHRLDQRRPSSRAVWRGQPGAMWCAGLCRSTAGGRGIPRRRERPARRWCPVVAMPGAVRKSADAACILLHNEQCPSGACAGASLRAPRWLCGRNLARVTALCARLRAGASPERSVRLMALDRMRTAAGTQPRRPSRRLDDDAAPVLRRRHLRPTPDRAQSARATESRRFAAGATGQHGT